MKQNNDRINFSYIILGILIIFIGVYSTYDNVESSELVKISVLSNGKIVNISGKHSSNVYRINAQNYSCSFVIPKEGYTATKGHLIERISLNDSLEISIKRKDIIDLDTKKEIQFYSLIRNNETIFLVSDYNTAISNYKNRWLKVCLIIGIILLLRGFTIISSNWTYIISIISFIIVIILRLQNKW